MGKINKNLASSTGRRTCLLFLGMHRSGTSALARTLNLCGAALPRTLIGAQKGNETGHWEPARIVDINDRLLDETGNVWDWGKFHEDRLSEERRKQIRAEVWRIIAEEFDDATLFLLKDPRICRMAKLYIDALREGDVDVRVVIPYRHPADVVASLQQRDGNDKTIAGLFWLRHVLDAERASRDLPRAFVRYDAVLSDWRVVVERLAAALQIPDLAASKERAQQIDAFLRKDLRHFHSAQKALKPSSLVDEWAWEALAALERLDANSANAEAMETLDRIDTALGASFEPLAVPFAGLARDYLSARRHVASLEETQKDLFDSKERQIRDIIVAKDSERDTLFESKEQQIRDILQARDDHIAAIIAAKDAHTAAIVETKDREIVALLTSHTRDVAALIDEHERRYAAALDTHARDMTKSVAARQALAKEVGNLGRSVARLTNERDEAAAALRTTTEELTAARQDVRRIDSAYREEQLTVFRQARLLRRLLSGLPGAIASVLQMLAARLRASRERAETALILNSELFDADWYIAQNADVPRHKHAAALHYLRHGAYEGRAASSSFSSKAYLLHNPDVAWAGTNPLVHYILHGAQEGRNADNT